MKQLLPYQGHTLVEYAIAQAQLAGFSPIVVVLGAQAEAVSAAIQGTVARSVVNENWSSGMGSSVSSGMAAILELDPSLASVAVLLADQPHVNAIHLKGLYKAFAGSAASIVAASYDGTLGVPALFRSNVFNALEQLKPEAGARALLRGGENAVEAYCLPEAAIDIDTPEDFAALQNY